MSPEQWSLVAQFASVFVTAAGAAFVVITLVQTNRTIQRSSEQHSYDVWRTVYDKMNQNPAILELFGFSHEDKAYFHHLSCLLTILDMYANKYRDNYKTMKEEAIMLRRLVTSKLGARLWKKYGNHFFSDPPFIEVINEMVETVQKT